MYSTVTFEGNLAADVEVKENKAGGVYVDAVVLVNQGKDSDGSERPQGRKIFGERAAGVIGPGRSGTMERPEGEKAQPTNTAAPTHAFRVGASDLSSRRSRGVLRRPNRH